jgi:cystathionine beta-lyase/cystathionine gamma-synthase
MQFATQAIHAGEEPDPVTGAHNPPLYQTTTYAFTSLERKQRVLAGEEQGYIYTRDGNPTSRMFERKLAQLERAEDSVLAAAGMGAIAASLLTVLSPGGHLVASDAIYPVAERFIRDDLPALGCATTQLDITDHAAVEAAIRPTTKALYVETLSNPTLIVADIPALAGIARRHGILLLVDNTFASPYLFRPVEHGADLVLHSATKYLSGHGDAIAGVASGSSGLIARVRQTIAHVGSPISPFNSWLLLRGIKTLELRMQRHSSNALALAQYLAERHEVTRVNYPGLPGHPGHDLAGRLLGERFGGMLSFEVQGGTEAAEQLAGALELCFHAVSLGDVSTLVWPWGESGLVRVSVGIEAVEDLIADFEQAFRAIG